MLSLPPMRILHTESSTGWGGQEIRILTEAGGMLARGHAVTLLTSPDAQILPAARERGIAAHALPIGRKRLAPFLALRRWLAEHGRAYDVINTHSSTDSWLAALACRTLTDMPPIVRTRHVSTAIGPGPATRWLYLHATAHIVTTGEALRQRLHVANAFALDHMTSVPTGIDLGHYRAIDRERARAQLGLPQRPTLGIVATLRDWKGHAHLLRAFAKLRERFGDWLLLVIGDGPQRDNLERQAHALQLGEAIRFVGNRDDVPVWLSALDLFTLPSFGDEGVPQAIMQAMACGLPVVSTPVGAIAEAVDDGQTGLLVRAADDQALTDGLARLMGDADLRARFGAAGCKRAQERFGIDIMLDRMERVFRDHGRK